MLLRHILVATSIAIVWSSGSPARAAVGACRFDRAALAFAGDAAEQAGCLLRHVGKWARVDPTPAILPQTLAARVGQPVDVSADQLRAFLATIGMTEVELGGGLDHPLSRANNNDSSQPQARYLVIHDTSAPFLGDAEFPADLDQSQHINRLSGYAGPNSVAHLFINRRGEILVGHDLGVPWRATKLEVRSIGRPAKGLFIHVELVQPRRRDPSGGARNDAIAPEPGFTEAQYESLALAYIAASMRAGDWLIPGFHAAIDEGLSDGHDDPQNFELSRFDAALAGLLQQIAAAQ